MTDSLDDKSVDAAFAKFCGRFEIRGGADEWPRLRIAFSDAVRDAYERGWADARKTDVTVTVDLSKPVRGK